MKIKAYSDFSSLNRKISIAVANFCMLIIGFAADVDMSNTIAFIFGFLSMGVSFGILR
jgi:hypothetical protein